jgi:hypothetical protein
MIKNLKKCSKCKEWKAIDEFHKNKNMIDGLHNWCKKCKKEYNDNYEEIIKENSFFQLDKDYIHTICKNCHINIIHKPSGLCSLNKLKNKKCRKIA